VRIVASELASDQHEVIDSCVLRRHAAVRLSTSGTRRSSSGRAARGERVGGLDSETDSDHSDDGTTFPLLDADRYSSVFDEVTAGSPQERARRPIAEETARIERNALAVADDAVEPDTRTPGGESETGAGTLESHDGALSGPHVQSRIVGSTPDTGASTPLREGGHTESFTDERPMGQRPVLLVPADTRADRSPSGRCANAVGVPMQSVCRRGRCADAAGRVSSGRLAGSPRARNRRGTSIPTTNSLRSAN
jgi:hypothetical protein